MARRNSRAVREVRKGGFWGKFLCLILGMFMGIFMIVGAVVGVGYYAYTRPVGKTVKMFSNDLYTKLFNETDGALNAKYASMTVGELIGTVKEDIETLTTGNLNSLEGISPLAKNKVDGLLDTYLEKFQDYGITLDKDELMQQDFSELGTYLTAEVNNIEIGPLIENFADNLGEQEKLLFDALFYDENGNSLTIGGMQHITDNVEKIGLDVLMDNYDDTITRALVYGPSTRYEYTEGSGVEPVMKQMVFTYEDKGEGEKLYDDQGKEMPHFDVATGILEIKDDKGNTEKTLYLERQSARSTVITYLAWYKYDQTTGVYSEPATYEKTTFGDLMGGPEAVLYGIHLKDVLKVDDDSAGIMKALAFNDDGSPRSLEYLVEHNDKLMETISLATALEIKEQGHPDNNSLMEALAFKPDGTERTLQDLNDPNLINNLTLKDVLDLEGKTYDRETMTVSTKILLSLAYGDDYELVDGKPQCAPGKDPLKISGLTDENTDITSRILLSDALNVKNDESTHAVLRALVFDENGDSRKLSELTGPSGTNLINEIKIADAMSINENSHPILIALATDPDTGEARTLQSLSGEGSTNIINNLYLKDALNLIEADPNHNKVLLTLAYGSGYTVVDGKYQPANGDTNNLRTIEMLTSDPDLLDGITLADALNIQNDGSNPLLEALAFDKNGNPLTIGQLTEDGKINEVIEGVALADALGIEADDPEQHAILKSLVFDADGNSRTLGDLTGAEGTELINSVSLTSILEEDPDNMLIMFFLRGRLNVHYEVVNGEVRALQMRILVHTDNDGNVTLYNEYHEPLDLAKHIFNGNTYTDMSGDEPITYTVTFATGVTEKVHNEPVDVYYLSLNGEPLYYEETNLGNVSDRISLLTHRITVREIIGETVGGDNTFLKHVLDCTVEELPDALEHLTVEQVFESSIYKNDGNGNYETDLNGDRIVVGMWKYMLRDEGDTDADILTGSHDITDLNLLVTNMTRNITHAPLNELKDDGIITGLNESTLQTTIIKSISVPSTTYPFTPTQYTLYIGTKETIGEMTVEELLAYVDNLIVALSALNSLT